MNGKIIKTRNYKAGYQIRTELVEVGEDKQIIEIKSAYTPEGNYIGTSNEAHYLVVKRGIKPELKTKDSNVCSIGFCKKEQKWYGWSHRAIFGFGVGDVVREDSICAMSGYAEEYLAEYPEEDRSLPVGFTAKDLTDAKKMAIAFADSIL